MSDFYRILAANYASIFPLAPVKIDFLKKRINKESYVLDLACGIGTDVEALAPFCRQIVGVDSEAGMIHQAPTLFNGEFLNMEMERALQVIDDNFELIYCVGNSLSHLESHDKVATFLAAVKQRCVGQLVIQVVNYERLIEQGLSGLPTIEFKDGRFKREYRFHSKNKRVDFMGTLEYLGQLKNSSTPLLVFTKKELVNLLAKAGFLNIELFGDFEGQPFSKDSFHLIISAQVERN